MLILLINFFMGFVFYLFSYIFGNFWIMSLISPLTFQHYVCLLFCNYLIILRLHLKLMKNRMKKSAKAKEIRPISPYENCDNFSKIEDEIQDHVIFMKHYGDIYNVFSLIDETFSFIL